MARLFYSYSHRDESFRQQLETHLATLKRSGELETWHDRRIVVVHDPLELDGVLAAHHELALHGHTHLYRHEDRGGQLIFNPGECAGHMEGLNAIGIVDLQDLAVDILKF